MELTLQQFLFEKEPTRFELLNYTSEKQNKNFLVQIFRNHSFELVEHTITPYLDYAGISIDFKYSGYDDSLSFSELRPEADLIILWIDATRYSSRPIQSFLKERVSFLQEHYNKHILIIIYGEEIQIEMPGVTTWNLSSLQNDMKASILDQRAEPVTGTVLSRKALLRISKILGLRYLPSILCPNIKAVVVDLDNTLYCGVLGEEGIEKIVLSDGHNTLQMMLKELTKQGIFLCVVSKNDIRDVNMLLEQRTDFPLRKEDFTFISASWDPKPKMIAQIAEKLNINPDSMLFIDDNIGELQSVAAAFPQIKCIHALENATITCQILELFPGLYRISSSNEDHIRKQDVQANIERNELQRSMSSEDYIRSLQLHLVYDMDNKAQIIRISELSNKTNQFIFNYRRYSEKEIETRIESNAYHVVSISLSDRLSDSGLIGVCVGKDNSDYIIIEECFISCRALGRGIDDVIILGAIKVICDSFKKNNIQVLFQKGPRNIPAEQFIMKHLKAHLDNPAPFHYDIPDDLIDIQYISHYKEAKNAG